jgi:hypothetical protein
MTNPLRLLSQENWADSSVITTGATAVGSLPAANLKTDDIRQLWRSTSLSGDAVIVDLSAQRLIGVVALINTSVDADDTIHVEISTSDPTGQDGSAYDSGVFDAGVNPVFPFNKFVHFIEPAVTGRYIRIGAATTSPMQAGRLVVAPTWAPTRDMRYGFEPIWRDFSIRTRSLGGNEFVDVRPRQRGWRFSILGLTEAEAQQQIDSLNRLRGVGRDILVCRDKDSDQLGQDTIWGLLEQPVVQRKLEPGHYEIEAELYDRV